MNKLNKLVWLLLSAIFAGGTIVIGSIYSNKQKAKLQNEITIESKSDNLTLPSLYFDKTEVFLAKETTKQKIESVDKNLKSDDDKKRIKDLKQKIDVQNRLNVLFEEPVLVGNKFKEQIPMKQNYSEKDVTDLMDETKLINKNPFYNSVYVYLSETTANKDQASQKTNEQNETSRIQEMINQIIVDGVVQTDFTLEQYYEVKQAVDELPASPSKVELTEKIAQIQTALTNMGVVY